MPQGIKRGSEVDLSDRTYDGREEAGYLSGGLGQLVDGQKGPDNFRLDVSGNGKGKAPLRAGTRLAPALDRVRISVIEPSSRGTLPARSS